MTGKQSENVKIVEVELFDVLQFLVTETGAFSRIETAPRLEIIQELETRTMSKTMCLHTQKRVFP